MKQLAFFLVLILCPVNAFAAEKTKGTDFFVVTQESWETGEETGYWIWHGKGVSHPQTGPFETEEIECNGAGFWENEISWGEGICIHGTGDDTRTTHWKREKGEELGHWEIVSGTGKYAGATGQGTYFPIPLAEDYQITETEGEVTLAE